MRIGIFDPYLDDIGGGERYMMTIAECLSKDHSVSIFWEKREDIQKIEERFSLDLSKCQLKENFFSPSFGFFRRLFTSRKYDVIIFLSDGSIPFLLSKKLLIHIQQPIRHMHINSPIFQFKLRRVKRFFFNSEFSKKFVDKEIGKLGVVLYPPVSLYPKDVKKENIILHVGRFRVKNVGTSDYKKQSVMIAAFKQMVDKGLKGWKLSVAVSLHEEDQEKFDAMKKNAEGYPVEFFINTPNRKLWDTYSKAKIYWHASGFGEDLEKHPEYAEHFGISTVEAMGGGAVPVVINAGGQKEIVDDGESGFLWDSLDELVEKTKKLINDEELLEKMSKKAKEKAKKFSGDKFCEEIQSLVQ